MKFDSITSVSSQIRSGFKTLIIKTSLINLNNKGKMLLWLLVLFLASCDSDQFFTAEKTFNPNEFVRSVSPVSLFEDQGFVRQKNGDVITISDSAQSYSTNLKYTALVTFVDENYIGVISGLRTFDGGWQYLICPTFSDLVVLGKNDLSVVFKKRIYNRVSDMKIIGERLYFEYGKYPDFKYGYFNFFEE